MKNYDTFCKAARRVYRRIHGRVSVLLWRKDYDGAACWWSPHRARRRALCLDQRLGAHACKKKTGTTVSDCTEDSEPMRYKRLDRREDVALPLSSGRSEMGVAGGRVGGLTSDPRLTSAKPTAATHHCGTKRYALGFVVAGIRSAKP